MCTPLAAASAGANVLGTVLSAKDASENAAAQQNARNAATTAELGRQKVYGDESRGNFDKALDLYTPANQAASLSNAQTGVRTVLDNNAPTQAQVGSITTATAPAAVAASEGGKIGDVFTRAATNRQNLGILKGYDSSMFNNGLALKQTGRDIDTIGDFSKVSAGVNKTEQNAAATNAYRPPSLLGPLFQTAGALGMSRYGGTLAGTSGASLPAGLNPGGPYI